MEGKEPKTMKRSVFIKTVSAILAIIMIFSLAACAKEGPFGTGTTGFAGVTTLSEGVRAENISVSPEALKSGASAYADFALKLFSEDHKEGVNTLISPFSVLSALAMTANGAENNTLRQMESVLGLDRETLNNFYLRYARSLPSTKESRLSLANSIWFTSDQRFTVNTDFLQKNANYFGADLFQTELNNSAAEAINKWVSSKTDGMIKNVIDNIPEKSAIMYLINALAFDAEWEDPYTEHQVRTEKFTCADGSEKDADFMYCELNDYLETSMCSGFLKYYKDRNYAFAALLPNEGVSVEELLESLTGDRLCTLLSAPQYATVLTSLPKFTADYDTEMSELLSELGMPDAFDEKDADLSGLGTSTNGNIYISKVIHKTHIEVDEKGTKAGAVTVIETADSAAPPNDLKYVYLDRPFIYMLIDCGSNLPFFIGTMEDVSK